MGKKREKKEEKKKGRRPCCVGDGVRKGAWTAEEDKILVDFITENGHGTWRNLPKLAGLLRCGKSCRLRWTNYLRPGIKRGPFSPDEENAIIHLHGLLGNKWAAIASRIPGRTDNDVKNFWNSHLRKRFSSKIHHPSSSSKSADMKSDSPPTHHLFHWESVGFETNSSLSNNPSPLDAPNCSKTTGDYFLRLWNSKVGESFRSINESRNECGGDASHSPTSQMSSLTKVESGCRSTILTKVEVWNRKKESEDVDAAYSDSSKSFEIDDSSDAMLKLLLDFPIGGDDMGFLEAPSNDLSTYVKD